MNGSVIDNQIGIVIIGRNEGDRLLSCFASVPLERYPVVYVDSASEDDSVAQAEKLGIPAIVLDASMPFTAARGRNAGAKYLEENFPKLRYLQFIDGDCELDKSWLDHASKFLSENEKVGAVGGVRSEKNPDKSIYNLLCDYEWKRDPGRISAVGGDAMFRAEPFYEEGGFNPALIAGEESDLCIRLGLKGLESHSIDYPMTLHDVAIYDLKPFLLRMIRGGFAVTKVYLMHGKKSVNFSWRKVYRIFFWGFLFPVIILALASIFSSKFLVLILCYPLQIIRVALRLTRGRFAMPIGSALLCAFSLIMGKFVEIGGMFQCLREHFSGDRVDLIEYK